MYTTLPEKLVLVVQLFYKDQKREIAAACVLLVEMGFGITRELVEVILFFTTWRIMIFQILLMEEYQEGIGGKGLWDGGIYLVNENPNTLV